MPGKWQPTEIEALKKSLSLGGNWETHRQRLLQFGIDHSIDSIRWQMRLLRGYRKKPRNPPYHALAQQEIVAHIENAAHVLKQTSVQKVVFWTDSHFPHNIPMRPFLRFLADFKPDVFIFGGDNLDPSMLSHWNYDNFANVGMDNIIASFNDISQRFYHHVKEIVDVLPGSCRHVYLEGNHEDWLNQFCLKFPQLERRSLKTELHDLLPRFTIIKRHDFYRLGKMTFTHGEHFNNQNPAKSYIERCKSTIIFGHHHYHQAWSDFSMVNDSQKYVGISVPCWTHKRADYGHQNPNRWQNGFFVAYLKPSSGNFSPYTVLASPNGHFIWGGIEYV